MENNVIDKTDWMKEEIELFTVLGFDNLLSPFRDNPVGLYRLACEDAFLENKTGEAIEVLRRGAYSIIHCKCYRHTEEFADLIRFKEKYSDFVDNYIKELQAKDIELLSAKFALGYDYHLNINIVRKASEIECVEIEKEYEENIKAEKRVEEIAKRSLIVNLSEKETVVLDDLSSKMDLPKEAVVKQALKMYQCVTDGYAKIEFTSGLPMVDFREG